MYKLTQLVRFEVPQVTYISEVTDDIMHEVNIIIDLSDKQLDKIQELKKDWSEMKSTLNKAIYARRDAEAEIVTLKSNLKMADDSLLALGVYDHEDDQQRMNAACACKPTNGKRSSTDPTPYHTSVAKIASTIPGSRVDECLAIEDIPGQAEQNAASQADMFADDDDGAQADTVPNSPGGLIINGMCAGEGSYDTVDKPTDPDKVD